jgi:hypothetical protein
MTPAALTIGLVVAQVVGGAGPASPPSPVELSWDAPAGCPNAETVRGGIARGVPSAPGGVARVRAAVVVRQVEAERWRASVDLHGADWAASRTLTGPTCDTVADAAGLVIVLALATELHEREVVVEAPPPPPPRPPPAPPAQVVSSPSSPIVTVGALADAGTLPSATPGLALGLGWHAVRARLELRGAFFSPQSATLAAPPGAGASVSLLAASLHGCFLSRGALFWGPCVEAGAERLSGAGFGPIMAMKGTNWAPFAGGGLLAGLRLSRRIAAFASADAMFPLVRARFSIDQVGQVHQPAAVAFRGAAGLELRFR